MGECFHDYECICLRVQVNLLAGKDELARGNALWVQVNWFTDTGKLVH